MKFFIDPNKYIDTDNFIDISIPFSDKKSASAWYVDAMKIEPVRTEQFLGSVAEGGNVNFRNIFFNPHGNGTHTECLGHISEKIHSVNQNLNAYFFNAIVVTITPENINGDLVLTKDQLESKWIEGEFISCVIRTNPNSFDKKTTNYSNTNPPYCSLEFIQFLLDKGIDHLLIDLPSVDKESDGGELAAHHLFWDYPKNPQMHKTITEFIFVPDEVSDGAYVLNLQVSPFENDAAPSRPLLFEIKQ